MWFLCGGERSLRDNDRPDTAQKHWDQREWDQSGQPIWKTESLSVCVIFIPSFIVFFSLLVNFSLSIYWMYKKWFSEFHHWNSLTLVSSSQNLRWYQGEASSMFRSNVLPLGGFCVCFKPQQHHLSCPISTGPWSGPGPLSAMPASTHFLRRHMWKRHLFMASRSLYHLECFWLCSGFPLLLNKNPENCSKTTYH